MEWHDAPADEVRTKFEVEGTPSSGRGKRDPLGADVLSIQKAEDTFNPYERSTAADRDRERKPTGNTTRTDLRKLSEWIKLMRALEEQKKNGGGSSED